MWLDCGMNLFVKELANDTNYYENLDFVKREVYDFKHQFVLERLIPLMSEIHEYELNKSDSVTNITISMEDKIFIEINGYPQKLKEKIMACFPPEQMNYLNLQIQGILSTHHN